MTPLAREEHSLAATIATLALVANDQLEIARRRCEAVMDAARPRGWPIALANGGQLRAMALTRAGHARDAEADARLAFLGVLQEEGSQEQGSPPGH